MTVRIYSKVIYPLILLSAVAFNAVADSTIPSQTIPSQTIPSQTMTNITVTASRTPINSDETASALSILSKEDIQQRNANSIADLLREIPGFAVSQQGSRGAVTQVRVRGAEANQILVLIDGVEANDVSQGSEFNFAHLNADQIERIEIVRGPQSALWGSDALAGVINIITVPRGDSENHHRLSLDSEIGTFNSQSVGANYLFSERQYQFSLGINDYRTDGTNISRQGTEDDGYENTTIAVNGKYLTDNDLQLGFSYRQTNSSSAFDDIDYAVTGLPIDADFRTDAKQTYSMASAAFSMLDGRLNQSLSLSRSDSDNTNLTGQTRPDISRGNRDKIMSQTDLFLGQHTLTFIAEHETEDYVQRGTASFFGDPNKDLTTSNKALAAEYRRNGEDLELSVSARQENNSEFQNAFSWRTTAAWHTNDTTTLFASVGDANKNPTFTERFGFFDAFRGNPALKPEQARSWELGVRRLIPAQGILISASWFHSSLTDEINGFVYDNVSAAFTASNNTTQSERQGLELDLNWRITEHMKLRGSYTYLDAVEDANGPDPQDEIRRPRHHFAVNGNYAWQHSNLNVAVIHTGSQLDNFFPPVPPFQVRVNLKRYTLVNIALNHDVSDQIQLRLRLDNALAADYEEVFGFRAPGRAASASIHLSL
ncbi:TonB-dependent receptor [Pseudomonadales bacterium]|nr:TonB-dependent receptor [Pseudomonadales bacterium]